MEDDQDANLDMEFKRYLQIMRPYLGQLVNQDIIEICNAWIQRLSNCCDNEKSTRNKYVLTLCYQLAKGILDEPFLNCPPDNELEPIAESIESETSTEVEYVVIDAEDQNTNVIYNNENTLQSETEFLSQDTQGFDNESKHENSRDFRSSNVITTASLDKSSRSARKQTVLCYTCPEMKRSLNTPNEQINNEYECRATNLIIKLRELKNQNVMLHNELLALKEESKNDTVQLIQEEIEKIDNATSAIINKESDTTLQSLKSLKYKLQEVQAVRNTLINTINKLQVQLDNFNEIKKNEINDIEAKHKLEVIKIKSEVREECQQIYDDMLSTMKKQNETIIQDFRHTTDTEIEKQIKIKDEIITKKDMQIFEHSQLVQEKDTEISNLNTRLEEQKTYLHSFLSKFTNKPNDDVSSESLKLRAQELEKRLSRMEKSKAKCAKTYEAKMALVLREKHLAECSLQLQLVRQRAHVVNEVADENQAELSSALDQLETKYKDIVANVQATAIQRRMQEQMALETILHAACGKINNNMFTPSQFSAKAAGNKDPNHSYDTDISDLLRRNQQNNKTSYEDDLPRFCLDSEGLEELFQKIYIPQRDTGDEPVKK